MTTLESVLNAPQPPKLRRSFDHDFGSFTDATGLAVDHSSGDFYVLDADTNTVEKFDSSGTLSTSPKVPAPAATRLTGVETPAGSFEDYPPYGIPSQLAIDQSNGDLYVPDLFHGVD